MIVPVAVLVAFLIAVLAPLPAQAVIVYIDQSSGGNNSIPTTGATGQLIIPRPALAAPGHVLIVSIAARPSGMTVTLPPGWTVANNQMTATTQPAGGVSTQPGGMTLLTFYKIVTTAEPADYIWDFANPNSNDGGGVVGGMLVFSGVDTAANPIDVWSARLTNSGLTHATFSITPTITNTMIVSSISFLSGSTFGNPTGITGITERLDVAAPVGGDAIGTTLQMSTAPWATTTATGASQATAAADADTGVGHLMALRPSLVDPAITMARSGPLNPGGTASYTLTVNNNGPNPEPGPITVIDTLPAGLTYNPTGSGGTGWACGVAGQVVTCTRAGALAAGATAAPLVLNVNVAVGASGTLTNTATVSGTGGDSNTANSTATDSYTIPIQAYAYYAMDEASWNGTAGEVQDSSGNNRDANTLGGITTLATPASGLKGDTCRGTNIPDNNATATIQAVDTAIDVNSLGNAGTISFWYRGRLAWNTGGGNNDDRTLFDATNNAGTGEFWLVLRDNGSLRFRLDNNGNARQTIDTGAFARAANTWVHVAATWSFTAGSMCVYVDGVSAGCTNSANITSTNNYTTLYVGDNRGTFVNSDLRGNSADGAIDEVRLYATALNAAQVTADMNAAHSCISHYAISYPNGATALTCEPLNVRITAHDAAHNPVVATAGTSMTFNTTTGTGVWLSPVVTGAGTWTPSGTNNGQATYTWPGGESVMEVRLRHTAAVNPISINLAGGFSESGTEDPAASFVTAGFRVTDSTGTAAATIPTQLSGKNSDTGFNAQTRFLQAIRTDTNTGSCVGVFQNQTVTVDLASQCNNPGTCVPAPGSQLSVRNSVPAMVAIAQNNSGPVGSYTGVSLAFDAQSKAPLVLNYPDAGQITLHARYALPSPPASTFMTGSSNAFVVRPFGIAFRGANAGTAIVHDTVATNPPFAAAGDNFTMTAAAYRWAAGEDADNDGLPDNGVDITNNGLTPNFGWNTTASVSTNLAGPANGTITLEHADATRDSIVRQTEWTSGAATFATWRYSEVGNALFAATVSDYISAGVNFTGTSGMDGTGAAGGYVGRFRPKHFRVDTAPGFAPTIANRVPVLPSCASTFTYMGEPLRLTFRLLAQNTQDGTTLNYTGPYAKLNSAAPTAFALGARSGTTNLTGRITPTYQGLPPAWLNGILTLDVAVPLQVSIDRLVSGNPDGPYTAVQFGIAPNDGEGVAMASFDLDVDNNATNDHTAVAGTTQVRYGRLLLQNAFGSELAALPMPVRTQYYDATANGFLANDLDSCTQVGIGNLDLSSPFDNPGIGTATVNLKAGPSFPTTGSFGGAAVAGGAATLTFSAPGAGGDGYTDVRFELLATPWLRYNWDGAAGDDDPTARATFGIYRGSPRNIYIREQY